MGILFQKPEDNLGDLPKFKSGIISEGIVGSYQTVNLIREVAHKQKGNPLIRRLAENIIDQYQVKNHYYLDEAKAIGSYVQDKIHYMKDPANIELVISPDIMVKKIQNGRGKGDCDDMALLTCALLLSIGHRPYLRIVRHKAMTGGFNHIYVVIYNNNLKQKKQRLVIDPIVKDEPIGFELKHRSGKEILV